MKNFRSYSSARALYLRGQKILSSCYTAGNALERMRGLLFSPPLSEDEALLIPKCNSIHTFFMAYPIDVCFLARDRKIISIYERLAPYRVTRMVFKSYYTLETSAGWVQKHHLKVGDILEL